MEAPYNFNTFLNTIFEKSPLQKKRISSFISSIGGEYLQEAEEFALQYATYLERQNIPISSAVEYYIKMCRDMVNSQLTFMRTGKYPRADADEAYDDIYDNENEMKSYMIGLALSQFLWPTHYEMYTFLKSYLQKYAFQISKYLEIGPGHGLFLKAAIDLIDNQNSDFTAIDISQTSIDITKSIIEHFFDKRPTKVEYHVVNMLDVKLSNQYDFITMGEVLEHVNHPDLLLIKLRQLLSENGRAFISTCVDCPTIDHVYHFESIKQIQNMIQDCDLRVIDEKVLPVESLPMEEIVRRKITINYCAIIERA
jgi:2-polyprenyl-3-methyl-5-hydroxy-6-metoxy-1,4-benzoquinol methylase